VRLAEVLGPGERVFLGPAERLVVPVEIYGVKNPECRAKTLARCKCIGGTTIEVPIGWVYRIDGHEPGFSHVEILRPARLKWNTGNRWIQGYLCQPEHVPKHKPPKAMVDGDEHL
jgi:hypothetical protein